MNILLITTDQQRFDSISSNSPVRLNSIQRVRNEGVTFLNAFTPIAQCVPARCSLLTGLLPHTHGVINNFCIDPGLPGSFWTYTRELRKNGFLVGQVGKWHITKSNTIEEFGFDDYIPMVKKWHLSSKAQISDPIHVREAVADGEILSGVVKAPLEETREYKLVDAALELMERYTLNKKPWHIRVEIEGPHVPWIVPEEYAHRVQPEDIEIPHNFYDDFSHKPNIQKRQHRSANLCSCYHDWEWTRRNLQRYHGYMAMIDDQISRLLDKVEELGIYEETLVIFTSDHGELAGAHNRIGKGELPYDELYRIPMVARWPGHITPGSCCEEFILLHDLAPTMLAAAEIQHSEELHGRNMLGLFTGNDEEAPIRDQILMGHNGTFQPLMIRILRDKKGKYVFNPFDQDEFYDLEKDPAEMTNQIDNREQYGDRINEYRSRLLQELETVKEKWSNISYWFLADQNMES